jgi:quercetin dioxygenase-like cupin family protein
MPISVDEVKREGHLVASNERYVIYDYDFGDMTVSLTELKKGQETRGHSHPANSEVYVFVSGEGTMEVGPKKMKVGREVMLVPKGAFHRVVNDSPTEDLTFLCVFPGKREANRPRYAERSRGIRGLEPGLVQGGVTRAMTQS